MINPLNESLIQKSINKGWLNNEGKSLIQNYLIFNNRQKTCIEMTKVLCILQMHFPSTYFAIIINTPIFSTR